MLDSIRKRANSLVSTFIIVATAAVMTLWGVDKLREDGGGGGGAAAWVNGEMITKREFAQEYEYKLGQYQQMLGNQFDEKFLAALQIPQRVLDEMIQAKLLAQQAQRLGVIVPDAELADHIRNVPYYQKDGKFDPQLYAKLPNRGVEERRQRERLRTVKFQSYLADRVRLTPLAIRRAYEIRETKVDVEYARIDFNKLADDQKPSATEIDKFLKSATDAEIQTYYDNHRGTFTTPAAVELKQIRVGVPFQASPDKKVESKKKIEDVAKQVTVANFGEFARKSSDDEYSKKGGVVGWVNRGTLEAPLEEVVEKLPLNQVSAPVETAFGYYLLLVTNKREAVVKPIAEVKKVIGEKMVVERARKTFVDEKRAAWEKTLAEGKSIEAELKRAKVEIKKTGPFSLGGGFLPGIGQAEPLMDAVFELSEKSPVAKRLVPHQDAYYFVRLKSVERPKDADFDKNREVVEKSLETSLQTELINQWIVALQKTATVRAELKFDRQ